MRFVALDLETTGMNRGWGNVSKGHRVIEVACVEILDGSVTGKKFQSYVNPEQKVSESAIRIHGISDEMLKHEPKFRDIAEKLLNFIGDSPLVIHNSKFDTAFLDKEFSRMDKISQPKNTFKVIDTLDVTRSKFPFESCKLDNLAKIFNIRLNREKHGALVDATILAHIFVGLIEKYGGPDV
jgi:DNA polymerase-3 subunit epsilon